MSKGTGPSGSMTFAAASSVIDRWITGQTIVADGGASLMNPEVPLDFQRP